ncbi:hypothetical protein CPB83DRAFT_230496 [Crepidotus variabilis]|uniref:Uncharacterized protein n=1 Tax=Crepidotus variabilis TaxID=179855 RepID=A0A9P6ETH7_9AGAR|nr:hypothetical protein CPB83DRAFT_230496 [Crepidotus variabilis]
MHDWNSPEEIQRDAVTLGRLANILFGLYMHEFLCSLRFDWDFFTRKRSLQLYLVPYFVGRYSLMIGLACLFAMHDSSASMYCAILYPITFFTELAAVCASITFGIRT